MPICIECCYPVPQLYHVLSSKKKAEGGHHQAGGSLGGGAGGGGGGSLGGNHASNSASSASTAHTAHGSHSIHRHQRSLSGSAIGTLVGSSSSSLHHGGHASGASTGASTGPPAPGTGSAFKGGGEAKKKKGGGGLDVRLMQCPRCKRFADKYVEHDLVVLFIDLVLVKPQVYRHLLFNRLTGGGGMQGEKGGWGGVASSTTARGAAGREQQQQDRLDPAIQRLGVLLVLFDVYLTWSAIETAPPDTTAGSPIPHWPILGQYLFYLAVCALTVATQHLVIRELAQLPWFQGPGAPSGTSGPTASTMSATATSSSPPPMPPLPATAATSNNTKGRSASPSGLTMASRGSGPSSSPKKKAKKGSHRQPSPSRPSSAASVSMPISSPSIGGSNGGSGSPAASANQTQLQQLQAAASPPRKNAVSTAIFVSSCMKLFPILMVVWKYEDGTGQLARGVGWAVALQNVEALRILLGCGYGVAGLLVSLGWLASFVVGRGLLAVMGLQPLAWPVWPTWPGLDDIVSSVV